MAADFQLQRALDVLRLGGVKQAKLQKPVKVFSQPKSAFAKTDAPAATPAPATAPAPAPAKDAPKKP